MDHVLKIGDRKTEQEQEITGDCWTICTCMYHVQDDFNPNFSEILLQCPSGVVHKIGDQGPLLGRQRRGDHNVHLKGGARTILFP